MRINTKNLSSFAVDLGDGHWSPQTEALSGADTRNLYKSENMFAVVEEKAGEPVGIEAGGGVDAVPLVEEACLEGLLSSRWENVLADEVITDLVDWYVDFVRDVVLDDLYDASTTTPKAGSACYVESVHEDILLDEVRDVIGYSEKLRDTAQEIVQTIPEWRERCPNESPSVACHDFGAEVRFTK